MAEHLKILLIEDDPDHATLIRRHLARADPQLHIDIDHVDRLQMGIERIRDTKSLDAVLCDLSLPDSSVADETVKTIIAACDEVPIIVLTSLGDVELATRSVQHGAQDYLVKSDINGPLLLRCIRYAIERKRAEQRLKNINEELEQRVRERTREIMLMQDIAVTANQAESVRAAFTDALARLCHQFDWEIGHALLIRDEDEDAVVSIGVRFFSDKRIEEAGTKLLRLEHRPRGRLFHRLTSNRRTASTSQLRESTSFAEFAKTTGMTLRQGLAIPVVVRKRIVAMLEFYTQQTDRPSNEMLEMLDRVGTQLGRVMERHEMEKAIADLTLQEQRRMSSDLHDGLGHDLSGLLFFANSFALRMADEGSPEADTAKELAEGIRNATRHLRAMLKGLAAVDIAEDGIRTALNELADKTQRRTSISCEVFADDIVLPNRNTATQFFRIAQEAVNNAVKHAKAQHINIIVRDMHEEITLTVIDDGVGIETDDDAHQSGMGMGIMRHRANVVGGSIFIMENDGGGTIVTCVCKKDLHRTSVSDE